MKRPVRYLAQAAVVAALYTALTVLLAPISFGAVQCRVSEALCVLPYLMPSSVWGLFLGCLLGNLIMGAPWFDIVFGSLATLAAALCTYWFSRWKLPRCFAPLPGVVFNALVMGAVLTYGYLLPLPYWTSALYVGVGQAVACYAIGLPLLYILCRNKRILEQEHNI